MSNWTIILQRITHVLVLLQGVKFEPNIQMKTQYERTKIIVTLYYFLGISYLNFNHVIIMKDFHNVFAYYSRSKFKKKKIQKNKF
jgi:hypothetical protein